MLVEIHPEPSEEERAAILVALDRLLAVDRSHRACSEWWQAGVRENVNEDVES